LITWKLSCAATSHNVLSALTEIIDQAAHAKPYRNGKLESIEGAQAEIEGMAFEQLFRKRELLFSIEKTSSFLAATSLRSWC
jgi:hypothetical protein